MKTFKPLGNKLTVIKVHADLHRFYGLFKFDRMIKQARELARYKLDLVGVQEVGWDKGGTVRAGDYTFFVWERK
jgi:hypothetical protein